MSSIANRILFEDNHIVAVNKQAGELVQGDKTGDKILPDVVKAYLKEKFNKPGNVFLGVIHRLDRPTSGALVFARTSKALTRMNDLFRNRETQKVYWALTEKAPPDDEGTLTHYLVKNNEKNKSFAVSSSDKRGSKAVLDYKLLASLDKYHLVEVVLHTGRHHQIRVQLSAIGCIIKGDLKYGAKRSNKDASISLHARKLSFIHPVTQEQVTVIAPTPAEPIWQAAEKSAK